MFLFSPRMAPMTTTKKNCEKSQLTLIGPNHSFDVTSRRIVRRRRMQGDGWIQGDQLILVRRLCNKRTPRYRARITHSAQLRSLESFYCRLLLQFREVSSGFVCFITIICHTILKLALFACDRITKRKKKQPRDATRAMGEYSTHSCWNRRAE